MNTDELERKLKEKGVRLIELLDEGQHLRTEQGELLSKFKQKQVLNRGKIEQDTWELESDNQVEETVISVCSAIKEDPRIEEKSEADKEMKWEEREKELAREK